MTKINSAEWPKALLKNSQVNILKCFIVLILKAQVAMQLSIKSVDARSKKELHRLLKIHYKWFAPLVPRLEIPGSRLHTYILQTYGCSHTLNCRKQVILSRGDILQILPILHCNRTRGGLGGFPRNQLQIFFPPLLNPKNIQLA